MDFVKARNFDLRDKIMNKGIKLKEIDGIKFFRGILTGFNEAFIIDEKTKDELIKEDSKSLENNKTVN